jgi:rod shape-determining protein MreC
MNFSGNFSINKKTHILPKIIIGVVLIAIIIFVLNIFNNPIKNIFFALSSPIEKKFWTAGESSSSFFSSVFNAVSLSGENDKLKSENQKLIAKITTLQSINDANQAQNDISLNCQNPDFNLLMAGVVGLDGQDIVSINKGSDSGVAEGMPVINQQNVIFGKVFKVSKNFSQVMLISNKKSTINVHVVQNIDQEADADTIKETSGAIKGLGNLNVMLDLVPVENILNEGDILVTSSLEKTFPKDLLVGKVTKITKDDQKPFQQAQIEPFFDINKIDNLFIITNYKR